MNEVIREFLLETQENLAQLDNDLVTLEKDPTEKETLARVFRTLHTVKGTAGFLGLMKLQAVAHSAETLLSRLRSGDLIFNVDIAGGLLATVDMIREMLVEVEKNENEGSGDYSSLIEMLEQLRTAERGQASKAPPPPPASPPPPSLQPTTTLQPPQPKVRKLRSSAPPKPKVEEEDEDEDADFTPRNGAEHTRIWGKGEGPLVRPDAAAAAEALPDSPAPVPFKQAASAVSAGSLRVDVSLLDKLMTLVGELVLARNQIMQLAVATEDRGFQGTIQRLNVLTSDLQVSVMKTRMQPINNIWSKFPRLVRDIARACEKQVRFEMEGRETELDKTIIEGIRDPLMHMVRNAIYHGIEGPDDRMLRGKPAEGRLSLHASHEGGKVVIEITDDGAGINPQRLHDKAIQSKLITPEQAALMSERELLDLIFLPGFTTADKVTNFAGRGVGMNVVRTNIEKIGGTVDIESIVGGGTTIKIKIPLTLAIVPALIVTCAGDCYAIPQISLQELIRLEGEQIHNSIEHIHGAPVYRLRGNLLPLIFLHEQLQVEYLPGAAVKNELHIVVLQAAERQFGLVVDDIRDSEEIVVKPLQSQLLDIDAFSGATIMGDGRVALILDVLGLAQRANVISSLRERSLNEKSFSMTETAGDQESMILFAAPDDRRLAVPLADVARLEEFPRSALEPMSNQLVVQYRGEILPLIDVPELLFGKPRGRNVVPRTGAGMALREESADSVQMVVHIRHGQRVGLILGRILDIVEETIVTRSRASQPGVLFTAVIHGRVTEVLDVEAIVHLAEPAFYHEPEAVET